MSKVSSTLNKTLNKTKNDISAEKRSEIIELLNQRLADCIDLQKQCKQAHWNVKGPSFIALHELFDEIATDIENYADLLAERIVQLGGIAEGTVTAAAKRSELTPYPLNILAGKDHVEALSSTLANFGRLVRMDIDNADDLDDKDTSDIFTEISRGIDKYVWFVESHNLG